MATLSTPPFRHEVSQANPTLVQSICSACGLIVAASKDKKLLMAAEKQHQCPVYLDYSDARSA